MERIIGIDYGRKRVGLAVSDPLGIFATPLDCTSGAKIIDYLKTYTSKEAVKLFVVGYPKNLDGTDSENLKFVEAFLKNLRKTFPDIQVVLEDERFTTTLAYRAMIDGGMKKSERRIKGNADKISAVLILQSYLDRQANISHRDENK